MPHVVVKGKVEGMESTVFGLTRAESDITARDLVQFGGRVGQDGQSFKHPPLYVITTLENLFGYRWPTLFRKTSTRMCDHSSCSHPQAVISVQQTLDELDFERGIWTAALDGDKQRVRELLNKGTEVDSRDGAGYTALHYAARRGDTEMCRLLLSAGANINAITRAGQATALHRAAMTGKVKVVELLVISGADVSLRDAEGRTAEERAEENNQQEVLKLLRRE